MKRIVLACAILAALFSCSRLRRDTTGAGGPPDGSAQDSGTTLSLAANADAASVLDSGTRDGGAKSFKPHFDDKECEALHEAFERVRLAGGHCVVATDCDCYSTHLESGPFDVSDVKSARELRRLGDAYADRNCPAIFIDYVHSSPCAPICHNGLCSLPEGRSGAPVDFGQGILY